MTLTYGEDRLPVGGSLVPKDAQDFLKRLRKAFSPAKVRFFLCGEYGEKSLRPHYHLCLFGMGQSHALMIDKAWGRGFSYVAEFTEHTAQYVAGYVVKKLLDRGNPLLDGLYPEFARMSLRPGLGADAMEVVVKALFEPGFVKEFDVTGDVPFNLKLGRKSIPLGRYLRSVLRDKFGMPDWWKQRLTDAWSVERSLEVRALLEIARKDSPGVPIAPRTAIVNDSMGRIQSVEARSKLRGGKWL